MDQYYVLSEDSTAYRVGAWADGEWIPGSKEDAFRERDTLATRPCPEDGSVEPNAKVLVEVTR